MEKKKSRVSKVTPLSPLEQKLFGAFDATIKEERVRPRARRAAGGAAGGFVAWWKTFWEDLRKGLALVAAFLREKPFASAISVVTFIGVCIAGLATSSSTMSAIRVADAVVMLIDALQRR